MAKRHVIFALRREYAELKGVYDPTCDLEATALASRQVGNVLRIFSPRVDLTTIRPVRPYTPERSRWSRIALNILRREEGEPKRWRVGD